MQGIALMEPVLAKAARKLGIDQVAIRAHQRARRARRRSGRAVAGKRPYVTSAFIKEALDRGAEQFKWDERKVAQPASAAASKVRGVGVSREQLFRRLHRL